MLINHRVCSTALNVLILIYYYYDEQLLLYNVLNNTEIVQFYRTVEDYSLSSVYLLY